MIISNLQKFIIKKAYFTVDKKVSRFIFLEFYKKKKGTSNKSMQVKIITQSLERLIDRGLIVGFGHKTKDKFFIESIRLTSLGKKQGRELLGKQALLPFKIRKIKK